MAKYSLLDLPGGVNPLYTRGVLIPGITNYNPKNLTLAAGNLTSATAKCVWGSIETSFGDIATVKIFNNDDNEVVAYLKASKIYFAFANDTAVDWEVTNDTGGQIIVVRVAFTDDFSFVANNGGSSGGGGATAAQIWDEYTTRANNLINTQASAAALRLILKS